MARLEDLTRDAQVKGPRPHNPSVIVGAWRAAARSCRHVRRSFRRKPDFGVTSVNYDLDDLLARGEAPA